MLSSEPVLQSKRHVEVCLICGTNILLDHRMMDEHGYSFILAPRKSNCC